MNRRGFVRLASAAVMLGMLSSIGHSATAVARPNVIVIVADDMGYGDLSCHGNPIIKTPMLDRLHDQSVRFTDFHVAPMCTPTRGQLMTGVDCLRNGARWVGTEATNLRTDLPTMAEVFRDGGYRTGMFGKWHIGDNYPLRPQDRGFQETVWFPQASIGDKLGEYWTNDYFDDSYYHNGVRKKYNGFCGDVWYDEAIAWIRKCKEERKPFFCYLPNSLVHGPYFVADKYRADLVNDARLTRHQATFFGMILNLDENLGRLEAFLKETGLRDDTIVVFMNDNGGTQGVPIWNAGMKGGKVTLWEGGHRAPCFIRWPAGNLGLARDIGGLTQVQDVLPTLMELCGVAVPAGCRFDGESLADVLRGRREVPDRTLVVQYQKKDEIYKNDACVMWRGWRLKEGTELYDVSTDPHQDRNVIKEYPEITAQLQAFYDKWWEGVQPDLDKRGRAVIGHDDENPMILSASGWQGPYIVDHDAVRRGRQVSGVWNLTVARDGQYRVALRRWPMEIDATMCGAVAPVPYTDTFCYGERSEPGLALPITKARLKIGSFEADKPVRETDREVVFETFLKAGPISMQTWLLDGKGKLLTGAYYAVVQRLN